MKYKKGKFTTTLEVETVIIDEHLPHSGEPWESVQLYQNNVHVHFPG